jgi:ArsR family transcriptional regulator
MKKSQKHLEIFKCLSDRTRFRIFRLLLEKGELCVCEIEQALDLPQYAISRGLKSLNDSGLLMRRKEGLWRLYSVCPESGDFLEELFAFVRKAIPTDKKDLARLASRPDIRMEVCRRRGEDV